MDNKTKAFSVRFTKDMWKFLRIASVEQERSMAEIITECVDRYKNRLEKKKMGQGLDLD
jgi:hypothetical protein